MKRISLFSLLIATMTLSLPSYAQDELQTEVEKFSYMLGVSAGRYVQRIGLEIDIELFTKAIEDVIKGEDLLLTEQQLAEVNAAMQQKMQEKAQAEQGAAAEKNRAEGEAFLAENKTKEGVQTTESGLQYLVVTEGDGAKPKATDTVTVHYHGTLIDGSVFDSSKERGEPATFALNRVIPGWTEGVQLMSQGSTYKFFIPSELAYGERGAGQQIGPHSTLIFEVELLDVKSDQ